MKTQMQDTSLSAYSELRETKKVGKQAQTILNHLHAGRDYSLQEISRITGMAINAVSGRCNDLKKIGLLSEFRKRPCSITGKTILALKLPQAQGRLF